MACISDRVNGYMWVHFLHTNLITTLSVSLHCLVPLAKRALIAANTSGLRYKGKSAY
jgi:hypothetical protein